MVPVPTIGAQLTPRSLALRLPHAPAAGVTLTLEALTLVLEPPISPPQPLRSHVAEHLRVLLAPQLAAVDRGGRLQLVGVHVVLPYCNLLTELRRAACDSAAVYHMQVG